MRSGWRLAIGVVMVAALAAGPGRAVGEALAPDRAGLPPGAGLTMESPAAAAAARFDPGAVPGGPPPGAGAPAAGHRAAADLWETRSPLALPTTTSPALAATLPLRLFGHGKAASPAPAKAAAESEPLGAERARTLLRSILFPGWGQAALGHRTSGAIFALAETGAWASFAAFRIQVQMRRETYERTARLFAGIDLSGRDESFRKLVGAYLSSDDYNRLVVYRDAANLYYDDPVAYRNYIAEHELKGADRWSWSSVDGILEYRGQRKAMQRAALRANTALAAAVINRLVCTLHAARLHSPAEPARHSWRLEVAPAPGDDATAFRCALRRSF